MARLNGLSPVKVMTGLIGSISPSTNTLTLSINTWALQVGFAPQSG